MLIGYEASNALRANGELGDYSRELIMQLADSHVHEYRALLFCSRIRQDWRRHFSGNTNVSTFVPSGSIWPELSMRYRIGQWLKSEKVQLLHGLNSELPYHIGREVKTVVTFYGINNHQHMSLLDRIAYRGRIRYAFSSADVVVAVSEEARQELLDMSVAESKIVLIGDKKNPLAVTPEVVQQYFDLYQRLLG